MKNIYVISKSFQIKLHLKENFGTKKIKNFIDIIHTKKQHS